MDSYGQSLSINILVKNVLSMLLRIIGCMLCCVRVVLMDNFGQFLDNFYCVGVWTILSIFSIFMDITVRK